MELQAKLYAREAVQNYDASKGMSLASYVTTIVKQKLYRYVGTYQNVGRIPEEHIRMIGPLREAMGELENKFGRDPSTAELADHMGLPIKKVTELRKLLRKDLLEEGALEPLNAFQHDAEYEKAMLAYYSMSDTERLVFDYSLGAHNQPQLSTNDIAKKLKVSAARVSQLKKSVADKIKPYLGGII
jgi:DNA-directed RNA polymerase specialized sigma subunit